MNALINTNTWELVEISSDRKLISSKWVFKIKYKVDGSIERYKARLVAKGFNQRKGIDFHETLSPVVKLVTIRYVITLALSHNWELFQLDVNSAFLHGDLIGDVYMIPSEGYYEMFGNNVCQLKKSIYGLKQASRQWNEKVKNTLINYGFVQSLHDYSLFTLTADKIFLVLLVYVDDIIITGNYVTSVNNVKKYLDDKFKIKDLGVLQYFLGIEVIRNKNDMCLCQGKYVIDLLSFYDLLACKASIIPM